VLVDVVDLVLVDVVDMVLVDVVDMVLVDVVDMVLVDVVDMVLVDVVVVVLGIVTLPIRRVNTKLSNYLFCMHNLESRSSLVRIDCFLLLNRRQPKFFK
jgi:hypothetical protein